MSNQSISRGVSCLFFGSGPSTIGGFVVPGYVYTFEGMFFSGRWSHVVNKILNRVFPSGADCDPLSPPMFVSSRVGIIASLLHAKPGLVYRCVTQTVGQITFSLASARLALNAFRTDVNQLLSSANTSAKLVLSKPPRFLSFFDEGPYNGPVFNLSSNFIHNYVPCLL